MLLPQLNVACGSKSFVNALLFLMTGGMLRLPTSYAIESLHRQTSGVLSSSVPPELRSAECQVIFMVCYFPKIEKERLDISQVLV